jgi:exopolyphosphatase / guanosine-5'-triphosphate,3'-diphosphate pyrophosphatase
MKIAAVDVGTNTILLLIADVDKNGKIVPILDQLQTPRLGKGSNRTGKISKQAIEHTLAVLDKYKDLALANSVDSLILCGTSALREAINRQDIIRSIKNRIGYNVSVLDGEEEASLSFRGALSGFTSLPNPAVVIDIGGGSTEVAYNSKNELKCFSFPLGAVRITERFLKDNPPQHQQISKVIQHIHDEFHKRELNISSTSTLIGVAGTPTTLACLDQDLTNFDIKAIEGYRLSYKRVEYWTLRLSSLSSAQIHSLTDAAEGREDILTAASLILKEFMELHNFSEVLVSTRGLRYGIVLREWERRMLNKTAV